MSAQIQLSIFHQPNSRGLLNHDGVSKLIRFLTNAEDVQVTSTPTAIQDICTHYEITSTQKTQITTAVKRYQTEIKHSMSRQQKLAYIKKICDVSFIFRHDESLNLKKTIYICLKHWLSINKPEITRGIKEAYEASAEIDMQHAIAAAAAA